MVIAQSLGGTVVIQRRFDAEDWLRLVQRYAVTTTFSAPTPIRKVCSLPEEVKARYDRSSMRRMVANAAPWSTALKHLYLADFPADSLWEVYGSTELGVDCILEPKDQLRKPGSCGRPAPLVEVALFDDDGQVVTGTGPDHPGELFVRGRAVFGDYYKQHDRYLADQREGWQTVGDVAYRDDEGYYYICDRKKDMVISGGMNVYPAEVEAALADVPGLAEFAVFGVPDERWGEAVVGVAVVTDPRLDEATLIQAARDRIASYKKPTRIRFMDALPRTASLKVDKPALRRQWLEEPGS
jgi:long-chain acyl-CoA synthetase